MTNRPVDFDKREVVLDVQGMTKRFPGIIANDNVNLTLHRGEILALLGENGAGKSTLMNIVYGLYHADEGELQLRGKPVKFASPREAILSGIGMVHQHFQLIPVMTVAENVLLGEESSVKNAMPLVDQRRTTIMKAATNDATPAGTVRLVWGALWRALTPLVAAGLGALIGFVLLLLVIDVGSYLVQDAALLTSAFQKIELLDKASPILTSLYLANPTLVTIFTWLPLVIGALTGAALMVILYRHARLTWRGRQHKFDHPAPLDTVIDAVIDLAATSTQVQNQRIAADQVRTISKKFNLEVDPDAYIEKLPVGLQQRVEIVKALYRKAEVLILDEPTAVLTPQEGKELFKIMRELAAQGVSIIFITHKLKEVLEVADSIVVMRGGKVVGTAKPATSSESSLAAMMVGREVLLRVAKQAAQPGDVVLSVINLAAKDSRGTLVVDHVNFEVRAGEILGVAGVQGNGQTELVEVLTGLHSPTAGTFRIQGVEMEHSDARAVTNIGTAHVPEDRQRYGMVMTFPVADNLVLNQYFKTPFAGFPTWRQLPGALILYAILLTVIVLIGAALWTSTLWPALSTSLDLPNITPRQNAGIYVTAMLLTVGYSALIFVFSNALTALILGQVARMMKSKADENGLIRDDRAINQNAEDLVKEFDIRTPGIGVNGGNLSGGNQQKMVVAREFSRQPRLLIAAQPTRGIDVGSIEFIHQNIVKQRDAGAAVLLVSAELDEIMALSDRIAVMFKGQIIDLLDANTATREQLGLLMAGVKHDTAAD